jgi:hypothetical protein
MLGVVQPLVVGVGITKVALGVVGDGGSQTWQELVRGVSDEVMFFMLARTAGAMAASLCAFAF